MVVTAVLHNQAVTPHLFRSIDNFPAILDSVSRGNFCADMLTVIQPREYLRHVPLPWRRDVNEIQIGATAKVFKIALAVTVNRGGFLARLFDHLYCPEAFLFNNVAYRIDH